MNPAATGTEQSAYASPNASRRCWATCRGGLENGTLLGAMRNGTFIPHDDDFDVAVLAPAGKVTESMEQLRARLAAKLPAPYAVRAITSYATKLEVYDPTKGKYALPPGLYGSADYHHVTVDVQMYSQRLDGRVEAQYYVGPHRLTIHVDKILPCSTIALEGVLFPCPNDTTAYLVAAYGDISDTAVFNAKTGLYEQPTQPTQPTQPMPACTPASKIQSPLAPK